MLLTALALLVFIPFMIGWFLVGVDFLMLFIWPIFFWKPKNNWGGDSPGFEIAEEKPETSPSEEGHQIAS